MIISIGALSLLGEIRKFKEENIWIRWNKTLVA